MRNLINILCFAIFPLIGWAQNTDSLIYCNYPDKEAQPPFKMNDLLNVVLYNHKNGIPECFDPTGEFYYNITILADGTVAMLNLECINNNQSCIVSVDDISKLEKWTPAILNGENCNQKMRFKTYINFE